MTLRSAGLLLALLAVFPLHAAEKVTFDDHVLPIFQQSCLNCHNPDKTKGGLDLSTFAGAMKGGSGGKIAETGDAGSKLLAVVMHTAEPKMPPEGDKLGGDQIRVLKEWIEGGLLENKSSSARKPSKPKFDTALAGSATEKPEGPPPMPEHVLLEPPVVAARASAVHAIAASPWAPLLAVTGQRQVLLFDTGSLELAGILPFPEGDPVSLAFTPTGRYLIVGGGVPGKSGLTVTFDVVTGERMLTAGKEFDSVLAADLTPDLTRVATGSPSRLVKIWKTEDGSQLHSIKKHTDWVTALDISPDGILVATGDRNGGVWVWESESAAEFHTLRAHQAGITAVAFRSDSNLVASASEDGSVRFWEMNNGSEVRKIDAHPGGVLAFAWSRDGQFATSGRDRKVKVWKADFNLLREIPDQPDLPLAVAFDHEGKRVFAADYHGRITAWLAESGQVLGQFDANPPSIETRLARLREEIQGHPARVSTAEAKAAETTARLDQARKNLQTAESELQQARDAHAKAQQAEQELRQRLETLKTKTPELQAAVDQSRQQHDAAQKTLADRQAALAAVDARIQSTDRDARTAQEELRRLEAELQKARDENRQDAVAALEAAVQNQKPLTEAATAALETVRSQRNQEQATLDQAQAQAKSHAETLAARENESQASRKDLESLPPAIEEAARAAAETQNRIAPKEAPLQGLREALQQAETAHHEAAAALESTRQQLPHLQQRERHWQAAAFNASSMKLAAEAEAAQREAEGCLEEFKTTALAIGEISTQLEQARQALEAPAETPSPEAAPAPPPAESLAKVDALARKLSETGQRLQELRTLADQHLPRAFQLRQQSGELKARYHATLQPPPP